MYAHVRQTNALLERPFDTKLRFGEICSGDIYFLFSYSQFMFKYTLVLNQLETDLMAKVGTEKFSA